MIPERRDVEEGVREKEFFFKERCRRCVEEGCEVCGGGESFRCGIAAGVMLDSGG